MKQLNFYFLYIFMLMILVMLMILLSVAFLTLMERKILGFIQIRQGPNKLGFKGILQPFSDAIKLLFKEDLFMNKLNYLYFYFSPIFMLIMTLMMWMIYPFINNLMMLSMGFIYLMCCFSISGYGLLLTGWSSNSSYSMLGSIRSLAQSISYEVSLSIIMISSFMLIMSFNINNFMNLQKLFMFIYMWPISLMFFFSIMAELNRTPFDFSEGESELVSGFNVEYSSGGFVLIFLSEYSGILFMSFLFSMFYLGADYYSLMFYFKIMLMSFLIIWIRGSLPRFRYDLLMNMCWLKILPFSLNYMIYMIMFKDLI